MSITTSTHVRRTADPNRAHFGPRIFALVIVIDDYPGTNRLQGCVNDGNAMVQFLRGRLFVPPQQIVTLFDRAATRRAILSTFRSHFIENENIQKGDAMVFFYGGHGSVEPVDASWLAERNKVETICPFDLDFKTQGRQCYALCIQLLELERRDPLVKKYGGSGILLPEPHQVGRVFDAIAQFSFHLYRQFKGVGEPPPVSVELSAGEGKLNIHPGESTKSVLLASRYNSIESSSLHESARSAVITDLEPFYGRN
ncbi:hypothetical protein AcV7_005253 [Taiwanofungus camphoratus]|nr:hypothetical protein AcV7_005253 [Antrodia cinnamomea]